MNKKRNKYDIWKLVGSSNFIGFAEKAIKKKFNYSSEHEFPNQERPLYVIGRSENDLEGYLEGPTAEPVGNISDGTYMGIKAPWAGPSQDSHGREITKERLLEFKGYKDYTGMGRILSVFRFDYSSNEIGSKLLDYVMKEGYELIESTDSSDWVIRKGFERSGVFIPCLNYDGTKYDDEIFVWHNPAFNRIKKNILLKEDRK